MMLVVLMGLVACVMSEPMERPDPEICDDGIDNDGDGLVDCDDESCGGINCQRQDTGFEEEPVEIVISQSRCCDFTFNDQNCSGRLAGTIDIINRTDEAGEIGFVRCDNLEFGAPANFRVQGSGDEPQSQLLRADFPEQSTLTIEVLFDCQTDAAFSASCEASATAGPFGDDRGFLVRGSIGL